MSVHPVKKYTAFIKLTKDFQNDCRKTEEEIKAFTGSVELFQTKTDLWIKTQNEMLDSQTQMLPVNTQQLVDIMQKATDLSLAMSAHYKREGAYQKNQTKFAKELKELISNRSAVKLIAELPKTTAFVKKNHQVLAAELAALKREIEPVKKLKDELEALYKMTYN